MNPGLLDCREVTAYIKKNMTCSVELVEDERYAPGLAAAALESQFGRGWPQTTGIEENGLVRFAMAALLEYLHDTQIKGVERLKTVIIYNKAQFMRLSPVTRANLELTRRCAAAKSGAPCSGCWTRPALPWASGCCAAGSNSRSFPVNSSTTA